MTGFAAASADVGGLRLSVELRSVNHRFADLRLRVPPELGPHEGAIRRRVLDRIGRGRVDLYVGLAAPDGGGRCAVQVNRPLLEAALRAWTRIRDEWGLSGEPAAATVLGLPGMFSSAPAAAEWDEAHRAVLERTLDAALERLEQERRREGALLGQELAGRCAAMRERLQALRCAATGLAARHRDRLVERLHALAPEVRLDPARLAQEAALLADRLDVTEELVRLDGHLGQLAALLSGDDDEPVGKRIEFLLQEIGRETNTVGSKASDAALVGGVLALKAELEKAREQVQNVE